MYRFFLNWMGVVSHNWYVKNGCNFTSETRWSDTLNKEITARDYHPHYSCGRIDVSGGDLIWNHEISVPVMEDESWVLLADWLYNLEMDHIPVGDGIFSLFEQDTGHKIKWFKPIR